MTVAMMARPDRALPASAIRLLVAARSALADAAEASDSGERYAAAHLAALRTAAVVLADRTRPADPRVRRRPTSAWTLLTGVAPELGEWAAYFAAGAAKRAAAEAGIRSAVTAREADDLVRDASIFLQLVETTVGVLPGTVQRAG
jgi:SAV_6107-like HEPN